MISCHLEDGKKYSRPELNEIAKACKIKYILKYKKNELITKIKEESSTKMNDDDSQSCIKEVFSKCNLKVTDTDLKKIMNMIKGKNVVIPTSVKEISFDKPKDQQIKEV